MIAVVLRDLIRNGDDQTFVAVLHQPQVLVDAAAAAAGQHEARQHRRQPNPRPRGAQGPPWALCLAVAGHLEKSEGPVPVAVPRTLKSTVSRLPANLRHMLLIARRPTLTAPKRVQTQIVKDLIFFFLSLYLPQSLPLSLSLPTNFHLVILSSAVNMVSLGVLSEAHDPSVWRRERRVRARQVT